jgi:hypothetical protein
MTRKLWNELWWVSVGGNKCEPARVLYHPDGPSTAQDVPRTIFTIGCADGIEFHPECTYAVSLCCKDQTFAGPHLRVQARHTHDGRLPERGQILASAMVGYRRYCR